MISTWWWKLPVPFRGRERASNKLARVNILGGGQRRSKPLRPVYRQGKVVGGSHHYSADNIEEMRDYALTRAQRTGDWATYRLEIANLPAEGGLW